VDPGNDGFGWPSVCVSIPLRLPVDAIAYYDYDQGKMVMINDPANLSTEDRAALPPAVQELTAGADETRLRMYLKPALEASVGMLAAAYVNRILTVFADPSQKPDDETLEVMYPWRSRVKQRKEGRTDNEEDAFEWVDDQLPEGPNDHRRFFLRAVYEMKWTRFDGEKIEWIARFVPWHEFGSLHDEQLKRFDEADPAPPPDPAAATATADDEEDERASADPKPDYRVAPGKAPADFFGQRDPETSRLHRGTFWDFVRLHGNAMDFDVPIPETTPKEATAFLKATINAKKQAVQLDAEIKDLERVTQQWAAEEEQEEKGDPEQVEEEKEKPS
jgi:hypothetical protein